VEIKSPPTGSCEVQTGLAPMDLCLSMLGHREWHCWEVWPCWSGCGLVGVSVALLEWVWPCWSGCGLVGVGVALLEWVWPCWRKCVTLEVGFEVSSGQYGIRTSSWLPLDQEVELPVPPALQLTTCRHASCCGNNGLNLWNCKPAPVKWLPLWESPWS